MRVLVVEDDARLRKSLERTLTENGYAVDTAGDGATALVKAASVDYDVIVLDVMLPVMNGWDVIDRLRHTSTTPVLMLTARDTPPDRVKGLDLGADDYLVKPFDLPELLARLRALIRRTGQVATPTIQLRDVTIDLRSRSVTSGGSTIALTAAEFGVLEYLAIHRGKVVSRTELYEHLRGEGDDTLSNIMDVHVASIRRKLGADIIRTRRGHGYAIDA